MAKEKSVSPECELPAAVLLAAGGVVKFPMSTFSRGTQQEAESRRGGGRRGASRILALIGWLLGVG